MNTKCQGVRKSLRHEQQKQLPLFVMPASTADIKTADIVSDSYLQSVLATSLDTRQQCMNLINLVEANAIAVSQTPSFEVHLDVSKQQRLLYSHLGHLRELNRNAILRVRNTKQTTAEARQEIDRLHLQLQNLYYEERHLRGDIAACDSYEYVRLAHLDWRWRLMAIAQSQIPTAAPDIRRRIP